MAATRNASAVWIVDGDQWRRALLRAELIERGHDAVGFVTLEDALARLVRSEAESPRLLVVALDGSPPSPHQLELLARRRVAVAFTGGAVALAAPELRAFPAAAVLRRPLTLGALADAVEGLAAARAAPSSSGRGETGPRTRPPSPRTRR